jgi:hypothetical protein
VNTRISPSVNYTIDNGRIVNEMAAMALNCYKNRMGTSRKRLICV